MASTFCTECGDLRISPTGGTLATCRRNGAHPTPRIIPEDVAAKLGEMAFAELCDRARAERSRRKGAL